LGSQKVLQEVWSGMDFGVTMEYFSCLHNNYLLKKVSFVEAKQFENASIFYTLLLLLNGLYRTLSLLQSKESQVRKLSRVNVGTHDCTVQFLDET